MAGQRDVAWLIRERGVRYMSNRDSEGGWIDPFRDECAQAQPRYLNPPPGLLRPDGPAERRLRGRGTDGGGPRPALTLDHLEPRLLTKAEPTGLRLDRPIAAKAQESQRQQRAFDRSQNSLAQSQARRRTADKASAVNSARPPTRASPGMLLAVWGRVRSLFVSRASTLATRAGSSVTAAGVG